MKDKGCFMTVSYGETGIKMNWEEALHGLHEDAQAV
jgi:hypothetical protein